MTKIDPHYGSAHCKDPIWELRCEIFNALKQVGGMWRVWKQRVCEEDDGEHRAIMTEWQGTKNAELSVLLRNNIAKLLAALDARSMMLKELQGLRTGIQIMLDGDSDDDPLELAARRREEQLASEAEVKRCRALAAKIEERCRFLESGKEV